MKQHPITSFFIGLIASGLILGALYLLFGLLTFSLAGGETLQQIESQTTALLIGTIIVAIIAIMIARQYIKTGRKFAAYGINVFPLTALVIVGVLYFDSLHSHTQFDKTVWGQDKWKPLNMATTLVKEKKLIGLTRQEVKEMLGQGFEENGDANTDRGSILYLVKEDWTLTVYFQKDKVVDTELRLPFLGV
jgi:drug/metabolite transporter superfamily protein YnfA